MSIIQRRERREEEQRQQQQAEQYNCWVKILSFNSVVVLGQPFNLSIRGS